jgi:hypothetical protein
MSAKGSLYISIANWQEKIATFAVNRQLASNKDFMIKLCLKLECKKLSVLPSLQSFPKPTTLNF